MSEFVSCTLTSLDSGSECTFEYQRNSFKVNKSKCYYYSENNYSNQIDDITLFQMIGRQFAYYNSNDCYIFTDPVELGKDTIYQKIDKNNYYRVPTSETSYKNINELQDMFISSPMYFSKEVTLLVALSEASLRAKYPSLLTKFFSQPAATTKYKFTTLYEHLKSFSQLKKSYSLLKDFNLEDTKSLQKFADHFSVGIKFYLFKDNIIEKEFRMPDSPELSPVPIIKIIKNGSVYHVLYSRQENENDGFDENGLSQSACQADECSDSFYFANCTTLTYECFEKFVDVFKLMHDSKPNSKDTAKRMFSELLALLEEHKERPDSRTKKESFREALEKVNEVKNVFQNMHSVQPPIASKNNSLNLPPSDKRQEFSKNNSLPPFLPSSNPKLILEGSGNNSLQSIPEETPFVSATQYSQPTNYPNYPSGQSYQNNDYLNSGSLHTGQSVGARSISQNQPVRPNTQFPPNLSSLESPRLTDAQPAQKSINVPPNAPIYNTNSNSSSTMNAHKSFIQNPCPSCNRKVPLSKLHDQCDICLACLVSSLIYKKCLNCDKRESFYQQNAQTLRKDGFICNGCGNKRQNAEVNPDCHCVICPTCKSSNRFQDHSQHRY